MKTKLAMFDLDGTLYDTRKVNYNSYKKALEKYGINLEYDYFSKYCNGKYYADFLPQIMGSDKNINDVHNIKKNIYANYLKDAIENYHLFNIIKAIKNEYYIVLVTTASRKNCEDLLRFYDRLSVFDLIISQEDVKKIKPSPEGFLKAMIHFNISNENAIVFEDSNIGINAALKSGATVFTVKGFS